MINNKNHEQAADSINPIRSLHQFYHSWVTCLRGKMGSIRT